MFAYDHLQETTRIWIDEVNLNELALKHNTDKAWHGYTKWYENHFGEYQNLVINLLEIGVASGASMHMWNDWFTHRNASFLGIDIVEDTPKNFDNRTSIVIADGTNFDWTGPKFDIIIDDGSHTSDDIMRAIDNWWKHLEPGGWYVIEDLAVQWRNDYGGGGKGSPATDMLKKILDQIWQKDTKSVTEFHAYDEIVFLRKS